MQHAPAAADNRDDRLRLPGPRLRRLAAEADFEAFQHQLLAVDEAEQARLELVALAERTPAIYPELKTDLEESAP